MAYFANIIIDISHEKLDHTFQYRIPRGILEKVYPGVQVVVPFGKANRMIRGFVVEVTDQAAFEVNRIKEVDSVFTDGVAVEGQLIALAAWIRKNYGGTMNQALKTVIPIKRKAKAKQKRTVCLAVQEEEARRFLAEFEKKHNTARARLLAELLKHPKLSYEVVTQKLNVPATVIRALKERRILDVQSDTKYRDPVAHLKGQEYHTVLNGAQQAVVDTVRADMEEGLRRTYLLHGVTGSGKTEVYMELIASVIASGKQAIVLIPEIALTYQTVMRFYGRFGGRVSILNSKLSIGERYDQFVRAKNGEIDIMIGPRSALFTPFLRLGLIIIDEEHEGSYKSETLPKYHARETAIARARLADASVVLGSATPSIDSYYRALNGEYCLLELKQRAKEQPLPVCHIADLREELKKGNRSVLSARLQHLIEGRLLAKQQILLFLNRRGLSGFVSCRACGHVIKCPHCDVSLSLHRQGAAGTAYGALPVQGLLKCHYCGYGEPAPTECPVCGSKYISGFKAGTQRMEEIVKQRFPSARVLRMDLDTTKNKGGYEKILSAFANHEADILIGTQMIVKGHDFPDVTLVGILAADLSMYAADYRAAERTFQLLTQAAGRAGRGDKLGEVVIQTYNPDHYSIRTARMQDYNAFYHEEIAVRKLLSYPPVSHMALILFAAKNGQAAKQAADYVAGWLKREPPAGLRMIGPAEASVAKVNDIFRQVIYLKHIDYGQLVLLKDNIERLVEEKIDKKQINISFDFDPMNGM